MCKLYDGKKRKYLITSTTRIKRPIQDENLKSILYD